MIQGVQAGKAFHPFLMPVHEVEVAPAVLVQGKYGAAHASRVRRDL